MSKIHYIPWAILTAAGGLVIALWSAGSLGASKPTPRGLAASPDHTRQKHYVTPRQVAASNTMIHQVVEALQVPCADGRTLRWEQLSGGRPLVLVFIKNDCPCSIEFEPFFQRVERLYRDAVRFAGVIDAPVTEARDYAASQHVPYPVLADPQCRISRRLRAENGGYFVLLTPEGVIDGFWPGCSADGMRELGRRIALLTELPERPLDVSGMPGPLTTGCPFEP